LKNRSLLLEIKFANKLPIPNAEVKILQRNSFQGDKNFIFFGQIFIEI